MLKIEIIFKSYTQVHIIKYKMAIGKGGKGGKGGKVGAGKSKKSP